MGRIPVRGSPVDPGDKLSRLPRDENTVPARQAERRTRVKLEIRDYRLPSAHISSSESWATLPGRGVVVVIVATLQYIR